MDWECKTADNHRFGGDYAAGYRNGGSGVIRRGKRATEVLKAQAAWVMLVGTINSEAEIAVVTIAQGRWEY